MKMWEMLQAAYDFWRPNKYGIKPYLCKDGRKHPVAIICRAEHIQWCVLLLRVCR